MASGKPARKEGRTDENGFRLASAGARGRVSGMAESVTARGGHGGRWDGVDGRRDGHWSGRNGPLCDQAGNAVVLPMVLTMLAVLPFPAFAGKEANGAVVQLLKHPRPEVVVRRGVRIEHEHRYTEHEHECRRTPTSVVTGAGGRRAQESSPPGDRG